MHIVVPDKLASTCRRHPERERWLASLPHLVTALRDRWELQIAAPLDGAEGSCSWVAPARRCDGAPAMLKLSMPAMESEHEIAGLRFWDGDPTVRVLEGDEGCNAMLLERCEPGTPLRGLPEADQDAVLASLLARLWQRPPPDHPFRHLSEMTRHWARESMAASEAWPDPGLAREGLQLFEALSQPSPQDVLLATDLHAGNVLHARREPWLVIDPKPFIGDRAYDATQHLLNCRTRVLASPDATIKRFAELLEVDHERVRLWLFAREAAESRSDWDEDSIALAKALGRRP